jgi:MFS family permease
MREKLCSLYRIDVGHMVAALRHRNYRLFFVGQTISNVGTWMQKIAVSWLIYRMTGSVFMLGLANFAGQIPSFVIAPFAGVLADRYPRRRLMLTTQTLAMLQAVALAALVCLHTEKVWPILLLNCFMGLLNACDLPVRQSFTVEMLEGGNERDLSNAIALNSSMVNMAKLIGPTTAGIIISLAGEQWCFVLNAVSYLAVLLSLLMMRVPVLRATTSDAGMMAQLREGMTYVLRHRLLFHLLLLLATTSFMGHPYISLLPAFAKLVLNGGPNTLGILMASQGLGALCGALYLASRTTTDGLERRIAFFALLFGVALGSFTLSRHLLLSMALLVITGFGMMVHMAASNTLLQTLTGEEMRGRIMSFYAMSVMGMTPFGSLVAGKLASRIGPCNAVMIGVGFCAVSALVYLRVSSAAPRELSTAIARTTTVSTSAVTNG